MRHKPRATLQPGSQSPGGKLQHHARSDNEIRKTGSKLTEQLIVAVKCGLPADVEGCLRDGASPDVRIDENDNRLLHLAARDGILLSVSDSCFTTG